MDRLIADAVREEFFEASGRLERLNQSMQEKESTLKMMLQIKAYTEHLNQSKSGRDELDVVTTNQKQICKHLSRILLVFMEVLDMHQSKFREGKGIAEKRAFELIQQVKSIFNCFAKFDGPDTQGVQSYSI